MEKKKSVLVVLWHSYLSLATTILFTQLSHGKNPNVFCRKAERQALLAFKQGLIDPSNQLSSWTGEECCFWKGIGCDNITGHVIHLKLRNPYDPTTDYEALERSRLGGIISDSLLELKYLLYIDLSFSHFEGHQIPSFFGHLRNLRYLNLSQAGFVGDIPFQFANLTKLHYLDIRGLFLDISNLEWLSHLSLLEFLDMSVNNLNKASNWLQMLNMVPSLSELHLSACQLDDKYDPIPSVNFTSLTLLDLSLNHFVSSTFDWLPNLPSLVTLDLGYNRIQVPIHIPITLKSLYLGGNNFLDKIPNWLFNITTLETLDLSGNHIQGVLPNSFGCLSQLKHLDLSLNGLEGKLPSSLGNLCNLQHLDLSHNKLGRGLYEVLGNSSACHIKSLEYLHMEDNRLSGVLPDQLGKFQKLSVLFLDSNLISGPIPVSIGNLSSLRVLSIADNQLSGTIPVSFGLLSNLETLLLSQNFLEGLVSEMHLSNLTGLKYLYADSNLLTLKVSSNWVPPFQLQSLKMESWRLGPRFPSWLQSQKDLRYLDLSNTKISDVIPSWFWSHSSRINILDLSKNQLQGSIPRLSVGETVYLGSNNFSGPLPRITSRTITELDLSNNSFSGRLSPMICEHDDGMRRLAFLDLSRNLLSGELPDCWMNYSTLKVLHLGNNSLTGNIPSSLGFVSTLQSLSLYKNNMLGDLPMSLQNCTSLRLLDLTENHLSGSLPSWLGNSYYELVVLMLRSNKFSGSIPRELCHLTSLQILDLARNNFSGHIPRCFGNFSAMVRQDDSSGVFDFLLPLQTLTETAVLVTKGREYKYYSQTLALVRSMDLSSNNLIGEIPEGVISLYSLRFLNLSANKLNRGIPDNINAMKLLESLDLSWNQLTGAIPQSLASLTSLSHLNLSYNNLSGRIPSSTQIQTFSALSFIGNHDLCGPPLTVSCIGDDPPPEPTPNADNEDGGEDDGWIDMKWFYISIPLGFVVGFWGILGPLAFSKVWRFAYLRFLDYMLYRLFWWCLRA